MSHTSRGTRRCRGHRRGGDPQRQVAADLDEVGLAPDRLGVQGVEAGPADHGRGRHRLLGGPAAEETADDQARDGRRGGTGEVAAEAAGSGGRAAQRDDLGGGGALGAGTAAAGGALRGRAGAEAVGAGTAESWSSSEVIRSQTASEGATRSAVAARAAGSAAARRQLGDLGAAYLALLEVSEGLPRPPTGPAPRRQESRRQDAPWRTSSTWVRSWTSPRRMCDLTVPSGIPRVVAMTSWVWSS